MKRCHIGVIASGSKFDKPSQRNRNFLERIFAVAFSASFPVSAARGIAMPF